MKLTLLGTGCPSIDYKRCGSSNLISTKNTKILVDCGSGVTQRLNQSGNSSADIDALLLTHLHTDHAVDFYQLIIYSSGIIVLVGFLDDFLNLRASIRTFIQILTILFIISFNYKIHWGT